MQETLISEKRLLFTRILSFTVFFIMMGGAVLLWIHIRKQSQDQGIPKTLRKGLEADEQLFSGAFSPARPVPTYPVSEAVKRVRVNGIVGLRDPAFDTSAWKLTVIGKDGDSTFYTLSDIKKLPKTEIVFDFKCIEGWSQKTWWGGVRFSDFLHYYHLDKVRTMSYGGLSTPDGKYYVGIDMPSLLHTQTLLCYEMNGKPLPMDQGYPLRLIIPVKYGIKHIKRIGTIYFSNERPPDYWAERGYDYYAGH